MEDTKVRKVRLFLRGKKYIRVQKIVECMGIPKQRAVMILQELGWVKYNNKQWTRK